MSKKGLIGSILTGIGALILIVVVVLSTTRVDAGYMGVQYSLISGMKEEILSEGMSIHAPWIKVYEYPISTETVELRNPRKDEKREDDSLQVNTGDAKSVRVDVRYYYRMDQESLVHIFKRFRRQDAEWVAENFIKAEILNATQNITTKHSVLQVYSQNREEIASQIKETLTESLKKDGIILEQFTFSDVRPDKETKGVLQQIADAENQREVMIREEKNLAQQENNITQEKKNEKLVAQEDKIIAKIDAEKRSDVLGIEAIARADANKKLNENMTENIIQYEWIKKWEGVLPIVGSDGGTSIINMPSSLLEGDK